MFYTIILKKIALFHVKQDGVIFKALPLGGIHTKMPIKDCHALAQLKYLLLGTFSNVSFHISLRSCISKFDIIKLIHTCISKMWIMFENRTPPFDIATHKKSLDVIML